MKKKPTTPKNVAQLQRAFLTVGRAVKQLQRRVSRLENKDRVIKGFSPDVDATGFEVEQDEP